MSIYTVVTSANADRHIAAITHALFGDKSSPAKHDFFDNAAQAKMKSSVDFYVSVGRCLSHIVTHEYREKMYSFGNIEFSKQLRKIILQSFLQRKFTAIYKMPPFLHRLHWYIQRDVLSSKMPYLQIECCRKDDIELNVSAPFVKSYIAKFIERETMGLITKLERVRATVPDYEEWLSKAVTVRD